MTESIKIHCLYDDLIPAKDLKSLFNDKNRNKHPPEQIDRFTKILAYQGWRYAVKISNLSGKITSGHGRVMVALKLDPNTPVPIVRQDYDNQDQETADINSDNEIARWAELDMSGLQLDIETLSKDFDLELLGIKDLKVDLDGAGDLESKIGNLSDKFLIPPFSVLNAREGWWQDRKRAWISMGIKSEIGRGGGGGNSQ